MSQFKASFILVFSLFITGSSYSQNNISKDTEIILLNPKLEKGNDLIVDHNRITISGRIKSDRGVDKVLINGSKASLVDRNNFYLYYKLTPGINTVIIRAYDISGNYTVRMFTVHCTAVSDTTISNLPGFTNIPPSILVIQPKINNGDTLIVNEDALIISGKLSSECDSVDFYLNNKFVKLEQGRFTIPIKFEKGNNLIRLTAIDKYYNKAELLFNVLYLIKVKPEIILLNPKDTSPMNFRHNRITISGKVKSENGIKKVTINDKAAITDENVFYTYYDLTYGENDVVIAAYDLAGNYNEKKIIVLCTDSTAKGPEIIPLRLSFEPALKNDDTLIVSVKDFTFSGIVSGSTGDLNLLISNPLENWIEPIELSAENHFSMPVILSEGINEYKIIALDSRKDSSIIKIYLNYKASEGNTEIATESTLNKLPVNVNTNIEIPIAETETNPCVITLLNPKIGKDEVLTVNHNTVTISGRVENSGGIDSIIANNQKMILLSDYEFYTYYNLTSGMNNITIKEYDKNTSTAEKKININYIQENIEIADNTPDRKTEENSSAINFPLLPAPKLIQADLKADDDNLIKKEVKKQFIKFIKPEIITDSLVTAKEKILTLNGVIETDAGLNKVTVNNKDALLISKSEFLIDYELAYGINNVSVSATDNEGNKIDSTLIVAWFPDIAGPVVKIISPPAVRGIKLVSKSDVIALKGQAIDESGVLEVSVNNRPADLYSNGDFTINLYLVSGDNQLIVKAVDKKYNVSVDTFFINREVEPVIVSGRYIALVIGINSYEGYWLPLSNAVNDARSMAEILKSDYMFDTVITIIDKEATRRNIIRELESLTAQIKPGDNLLIYYSGHGQYKKALNKGYWVPVDAKTNSTADFISNSDIKTFMGGIPSKHTLLISDACFAGDILRGKATESIPFDPNNMDRYYREVYSKISRIAITSGGLEEVEDAGKDGHSIFTYYLIKSLQQNQNKYLDVSQLFSDFRIAVTNNSEQTPQLQVVRDTGDEGGQFIFIKR